jgi:hypothetical protein
MAPTMRMPLRARKRCMVLRLHVNVNFLASTFSPKNGETMPNLSFLYTLPMAMVLFVLVTAVFGGLELGVFLGARQRRREQEKDPEQGGGGLVANSVFAILGLLLAFTYSVALSRYENRKQAVVSEANALGTAFLRAGLMQGGGPELQRALLDYARTRLFTIENAGTPELAKQLLQHTLAAQSKVWSATEKIIRSSQPGPLEISLLSAVNETIDMHTTRLAVMLDILPAEIIWVLLCVTAATMAIGGFSSAVAGRTRRLRLSLLATILSAVLFLIIDFDRPLRGFIKIPQHSLVNTIADMESAMASSEKKPGG